MPPHLHVACAIIERDGLILAARRRPGLSMAGKWEFPGGKIKDGENRADALRRELREELEVEVEILSALPLHNHQYATFTITLYPFRCRLVSLPDGSLPAPTLTDHDAFAWLPINHLAELDWAEADAPVILQLASELK